MTEPKKDKRCYDNDCPYHELLDSQVQGSLPRWVFISAFGTLCTIAFIFAAWHLSSLKEFDLRYYKSVASIHQLAEDNKRILVKVETKQDMVLDNIKTIQREISAIKANGTKR